MQWQPSQPSTEEQLFERPVRFLTRATFEELIEEPFTQVQDAATTVAVLNATRIQFTNSAPVTVTDLTSAQDGQLLIILGDGNTTLQDNARLELGANLLLAADKFYPLVYLAGKWYPLAGNSAIAGAGISVSGTTITNLYVGKALTIYTGSQAINTTGSNHHFPNNSIRHTPVIDTTGMGQYRFSIVGSSPTSTGTLALALAYSTDGSSYTIGSLLADMTLSSGISRHVSAWTTLPGGAVGTSIYIGAAYQLGFENSTIYNIVLELKP